MAKFRFEASGLFCNGGGLRVLGFCVNLGFPGSGQGVKVSGFETWVRHEGVRASDAKW